jgi:hypothetical protein
MAASGLSGLAAPDAVATPRPHARSSSEWRGGAVPARTSARSSLGASASARLREGDG